MSAALLPTQLVELARGAGFSPSQARTMAAIALGESSGLPGAVGDKHLVSDTWGPSIGLWQIRSLHAHQGTGKERDGSRLTDPAFNARAARTVFTQQGYRAWTVYNSGEYGRHLPAVDRGLAGGVQNGLIPLSEAKETVKRAGTGVASTNVDGIGGAIVDAGKGALSGIDAVGDFLGQLGQRGTWVRVLQVVGGAGLVVGGLLLLGKDIASPVVSAAADVLPAGRAVKAAAAVTRAAT